MKETYSIKAPEWDKWAVRRITMRLAEHWLLCAIRFSKFFGVDFPDQIFVNKDEICYCYINKIQLEKCLKVLLKKLYDSSFYDLYEKRALQQFRIFLDYCKNISDKDLSKLTNKDLVKEYENFIDEEDDFTNFLWIIFAMDFLFPKELEKELKDYLKRINKEQEFSKYQEIILACDKKTSAFDQSIDILKLAKKAKSISKSQLKKEVEKLIKKYHFFTIINFDEAPFKEDYFYGEINNILENKIDTGKEIKRINEQFKNNKKKFDGFVKKLDNDSKLRKIAEACHGASYYRDYRNDIRRKAYFYARDLYKEISKRLDISFTDLLYVTREDIKKSIIKNKCVLTKKEIESNKKYFAIILQNKKSDYFYEDKKIDDLLNLLEPKQNIKEFKGISASPGKITGKAKIVLVPQKDGHKLNKGDILIASMTNIDFVPLMSKASAVITDEGGLLCHAAIVSREMKKPCIVGTKIATKVIKDNDIIEVDANNGVVKIIKK